MKSSRTRFAFAVCLGATLLFPVAPAAARFGAHGGFMGGRPAFLDHLFPPRVVMRFQQEIELTEDQRKSISQAMAETQKSMVDLQWQSELEGGKLAKLLESASVDDKEAMAQADRVMAIETQMKRAHLALLVRVKNLLTAAQQTKLRELRPKGAGFALPAPAEE